MDQDIARRLLVEGGTLVFLDVPPQTEFGIDLNTWNVGDQFKGVKMIPPGLHFIFYSAVGKQKETAPRTGFFHKFQRGEILVKKWDKLNEDICEEETSSEDVEMFRSNLQELDRYLGVYPYESWRKWVSLTNYITDEVTEKVMPLQGKVASVTQLVVDPNWRAVKSSESVCKDIQDAESRLPKMDTQPGTEIRFSKFPERNHPDGCSAAEITKHNMDLSFTLEKLLKRYKEPEGFLGELQMAFVCFMVGQVFDAFEQWQRLLQLLCSCEDAITTYPDLFSKLISVLHFQLPEVPSDFFVDIVSSSNFLTITLQRFFLNLKCCATAPRQLVDKGKRFQANLTKRFKWDFDSESDEYAPVVVEM